jgi:hypothetical protein
VAECLEEVLEQNVAAPEPLRKEAALGDLGLPLAVDLAGQALRSDLLPVLAAVLVVLANPPDA